MQLVTAQTFQDLPRSWEEVDTYIVFDSFWKTKLIRSKTIFSIYGISAKELKEVCIYFCHLYLYLQHITYWQTIVFSQNTNLLSFLPSILAAKKTPPCLCGESCSTAWQRCTWNFCSYGVACWWLMAMYLGLGCPVGFVRINSDRINGLFHLYTYTWDILGWNNPLIRSPLIRFQTQRNIYK